MEATTEDRITTLLDAFEVAWSGPSALAFGVVIAPDGHYEDPLLRGPLRGPERVAQHAARLRVAFPDLRFERSGPPMAGGLLLSQGVRLSGTHRAELGSIPTTDKEIDLHAVVVAGLSTSGTRLSHVRIFFDRYDAAIQLGVVPRPRSLAERALLALRGFGIPRLP
ncbi:MAG: ester cyclase [Solirubrobacteraceae bacterium]|nr:ester cyclase [Solirubrobacteraceae bacterium]